MTDNKQFEAQNEEAVEETQDEEVVLEDKDQLVQELLKKIEQLNEELQSVKRGAADVMNRNRQLETDKKYASSSLTKNLLVPLSYFEGALSVKTDDPQLQNFLKGFEMIYNLLLEQLYNAGLKEINVKEQETFDPKIHEVFELVDSEESDGTILAVVQKGYYFKDRILKPAQVKVTRLVQRDEAQENLEESEKTETVNIN